LRWSNDCCAKIWWFICSRCGENFKSCK
jgi:hypothetical protein